MTTVYYWHLHHEALVEVLDGSILARVDYIRRRKPHYEQVTRLRWMTPVLLPAEGAPVTAQGWEELHAQQHEGCPWDGKTLLPDDTVDKAPWEWRASALPQSGHDPACAMCGAGYNGGCTCGGLCKGYYYLRALGWAVCAECYNHTRK